MDNLIATTIAIGLIALITALGVNYGVEAVLAYQAKVEATKIISDAERIAAAWRFYARSNNGSPAFSTSSAYCWGNGATDLVPNYLSTLPVPPSGAADSTVNYYYPALVANYGVSGATTNVGPTNAPADSIALKIKSPRVCSAIATLGGDGSASAISSLSGNLNAVGTSTSSVLIGIGSKSFTTQAGLVIAASAAITVASSANAANYMKGTVTSYNAGTGALVVNVTSTGGGGTLASWNIILSSWQPYNCVYVDSDSSGGPSQSDLMLFIYKVFDQNIFSTSARTACP